MHLTRFRLNTARPGARRLLASPQSLHAAVMASFPRLLPTDGTAQGPRVLWRLDHNARAEVLLYIVSPDRPDLTHLVEQAGWPAAHSSETPAGTPALMPPSSTASPKATPSPSASPPTPSTTSGARTANPPKPPHT